MKTEITKKLERDILIATKKTGVFGCFEVTIGFGGNERVDYMTYDTSGIFRCYEIKVTKQDFHSKCHNTFVGHYNYYVLTEELYNEVKNEIPKDIGVYIGMKCVKKAKRRSLVVEEKILKDSIIRSLYRESEKVYRLENGPEIRKLKREISKLKSDLRKYKG